MEEEQNKNKPDDTRMVDVTELGTVEINMVVDEMQVDQKPVDASKTENMIVSGESDFTDSKTDQIDKNDSESKPTEIDSQRCQKLESESKPENSALKNKVNTKSTANSNLHQELKPSVKKIGPEVNLDQREESKELEENEALKEKKYEGEILEEEKSEILEEKNDESEKKENGESEEDSDESEEESEEEVVGKKPINKLAGKKPIEVKEKKIRVKKGSKKLAKTIARTFRVSRKRKQLGKKLDAPIDIGSEWYRIKHTRKVKDTKPFKENQLTAKKNKIIDDEEEEEEKEEEKEEDSMLKKKVSKSSYDKILYIGEIKKPTGDIETDFVACVKWSKNDNPDHYPIKDFLSDLNDVTSLVSMTIHDKGKYRKQMISYLIAKKYITLKELKEIEEVSMGANEFEKADDMDKSIFNNYNLRLKAWSVADNNYILTFRIGRKYYKIGAGKYISNLTVEEYQEYNAIFDTIRTANTEQKGIERTLSDLKRKGTKEDNMNHFRKLTAKQAEESNTCLPKALYYAFNHTLVQDERRLVRDMNIDDQLTFLKGAGYVIESVKTLKTAMKKVNKLEACIVSAPTEVINMYHCFAYKNGVPVNDYATSSDNSGEIFIISN